MKVWLVDAGSATSLKCLVFMLASSLDSNLILTVPAFDTSVWVSDFREAFALTMNTGRTLNGPSSSTRLSKGGSGLFVDCKLVTGKGLSIVWVPWVDD